MNENITKEIYSEALKSIIKQIWDTLEKTKSGEINPSQASAENASCKHLIQAVALDWMYNKQIKKFESTKKMLAVKS